MRILFEYGGPEFDRDNIMNKKWRQQHGGMRGMREEDVVDENISIEDIRMLTFPEDEEIEKNIQAYFMVIFLNGNLINIRNL